MDGITSVIESPTVDINELIRSFSNYLRGLCKSEGTIKQYTSDIRGWWEWWGKPLEGFSTDEWDTWTSWQAETGAKGRTIRMHQCGVRRFYKWLRKKRIVTVDPGALAEAIGIPKRLPEVLTRDEVERMRLVCKRPRTRAIFALLYDCGLRNSEARSIRPSQIGDDHVRVIGKRDKERKVPIVPATRQTLEDWLQAREPGEYLFTTAGGNRIGMEYVCKIIQYWARASNIGRRITPHTLRHSIATHLIERGLDLLDVQEFLGHDSIETTRIYVHVAQTRLKERVMLKHPLADLNGGANYGKPQVAAAHPEADRPCVEGDRSDEVVLCGSDADAEG